MGNLRRGIVLATFMLWMVAMLAVPLSFADTEGDCGPYTGDECEGVVTPPSEDEEGEQEGATEVVAEDDSVDEVSVQPISTTDDGASALAATGVDAWVIVLVGVLLIGVGVVALRSRRQGSGVAG